MHTFLEELLGRFATENPNDSRPEALAEYVRTATVEDTQGTIDLRVIIAEARERFQELHQNGEYNPAAADSMRQLFAATEALKTVLDEQVAERRRMDEEFAAAAAAMAEADRIDTDSDASDAATDNAANAQTSEAADNADDTTDADDNADDTQSEAAVVAAPRVRPLATPAIPTPGQINGYRSAAAAAAAAPLGEHRMRYRMLAAAEVPQHTGGSVLTMSSLADAAIRRFGVMPVGQKGIGRRRGSIALIQRQFAAEYQTHGDRRDARVIDRIADERNLPGGSIIAAARDHRHKHDNGTLTAAGCCTGMTDDVWCAPSEIDYTLCPPLANAEGMVDLPTIPINHGGIRYPVWEQAPADWHGVVVPNTCDAPIPPDYFTQEGNEKNCIEGPCPTWMEQRLNIAYLCITGDILRERGYPELVERFMSDAMISHAHFMNFQYLSAIFDGSDQIAVHNVSTDGIGSSSDSVVDQIAILVAWFRSRYKVGNTVTLEGIAPLWFRDYLKADLARKNNRPFSSVTNAEIDELFAQYTTRIQWVEDLDGTGTDTGMPNGDPVDGRPMPGGWPPAVEIVLYPAGSWVLGQQDVITLDAFYDSSMLQQNKYTGLFFEEGFLLFNRCNRSFKIRLEGLCRNGGVAELAPVTCPETPAPEPTP